MKNLVICVVFITGCVDSAQLYRSDQFHPFPSRFPSRVPTVNRKGLYTPLVLDSHVDCLRELKEMKERMGETNDIVQTVKNEMMEEISKLREELEKIKQNSSGGTDITELKKQLQDTQGTVDTLVNDMADNALLLIDSVAAISTLDGQLAGTVDKFTKSSEEINANMEELRGQITTINQSSSTVWSSKVESLESELNVIKEKSADHAGRFTEITVSFEATNALIANLRTDLEANVNNVTEVKDKMEEMNAVLTDISSPSSIGKVPTSCVDLRKIGNVKSGLYSVMGEKSVQTIYCDFTLDETSEKSIGEVDVKSMPTYFSVQRTSPFTTVNTSIPFEIETVNIGGAMDLTTGVFTAPVAGLYSFSFRGLAEFQATQSNVPFLAVGLFVNNKRMALALNEESNTRMTNNRGQRSPLSLMTSLQLQKGDQVWLDMFAKSGIISLYDNSNQHTDFSGWLMQEYISH